MAVLADITFAKWEDGTLTVGMAPAVAIGGWALRAQIAHRFGGMSGVGGNSGQHPGILIASAASGYGGGQSGITVTNSGQGQFNVSVPSVTFSGFDPGNYAFDVSRMDAGFRTVISEGYFIVTPSIGL